MAVKKQLKQAQAVLDTLCEMLEEENWQYEKDDEDLSITCGAQGDDLPIELRINVEAERQLVVILSQMPFIVPEDKRTALAVAVSAANNGLADGSVDYNYLKGNIVFRMTTSFLDSLIGKELFEYMVFCACFIIDRYNDKFLMVAKSDMSNEEIVKFID